MDSPRLKHSVAAIRYVKFYCRYSYNTIYIGGKSNIFYMRFFVKNLILNTSSKYSFESCQVLVFFFDKSCQVLVKFVEMFDLKYDWLVLF
jgi:hypothetical protein